MSFHPLPFILQSGKNTFSIPCSKFYYNIMERKIKMISLYFSINGKRKKVQINFLTQLTPPITLTSLGESPDQKHGEPDDPSSGKRPGSPVI
jgi:hypothetical protein